MKKILFIGGTGVISSGCLLDVINQGMELTILNRGQSKRPIPEAVRTLQGDIRDLNTMQSVLKGESFDVVVDWVAFTPEHIETDLKLFQGKVGQFIFISSASAYQKPVQQLPITEQTPLVNPFLEYSRNKIACEQRLIRAFKEDGFPMTIVRPSHTYDHTAFPLHGGYAIIDRIRKGKKIVVHGDGTSLWTLTHHRDFAKAFVGLLGKLETLGEAYHITSDEVLTWNQIVEFIGKAAGTEPKVVYLPSDYIAKYDTQWGDSLLGDKAHSVMFDNTKIKSLVPTFRASVPFEQGIQEMVSHYDQTPELQIVDPSIDQLLDTMIQNYEASYPA